MESTRPFADVLDDPLLNIKAVSQATGIEPVTIRAWERRYGVPSPKRSEQGYRLYSERDVAILRWLKGKVEAGVTIKRAVTMLNTQNPQATLHGSHVSRSGADSASLEERLERLLDAAHRFDAVEAQQVISQSFALFPVEDVCLYLLLPALAAVGEQWRVGEASLQVEHFLTNLIRQQLLALDATMPPPSRRGTILTGCAPEEWHEMGTLMLSAFLRRQGWEVIYLGQAVGLPRLKESLAAIRPDVILLNSSVFESLVGLREAGELVAQANGGHIRFTFAGTLFPHVPGLAACIPGIYLGDTLSEAVDRIEGLMAGTWQVAANEPLPASEEALYAFDAMRRVAPALSEHLGELLLEADSALDLAAATEVALEALAGLQAAVRLELPALLEVPQPLVGPSLGERGVPYDRVVEVFHNMVGPDATAILVPYLALL